MALPIQSGYIGSRVPAAAGFAFAAVFTVTETSDADCSDTDGDLQSALDAAADNSQDDTINIAPGTNTTVSTNSDVTLENCDFTDNQTTEDGGGKGHASIN